MTSPNAIESKRAFINNATGVTCAEGISYEVKMMRFVMIAYAKIIYQDFEDLVKVSLNNIKIKRNNSKIDYKSFGGPNFLSTSLLVFVVLFF